MIGRWRRRQRRTLIHGDRPRIWLVDLRVPNEGYATGARITALGATRIDWRPPAAGPELEVTLEINATSGAIAERVARRRAAGQQLEVLAARSRRPA